MKEGRWIVLEDINLAPLEIISTLIPLLETRKLFIPGRDEVIPAHTQFQLFATQKTSSTSLTQHGLFGMKIFVLNSLF